MYCSEGVEKRIQQDINLLNIMGKYNGETMKSTPQTKKSLNMDKTSHYYKLIANSYAPGTFLNLIIFTAFIHQTGVIPAT